MLFGLNALGLMVASQVNGRLVGHLTPRRLLAVGLVATACGGAALLVAVAGGLGLPGPAGVARAQQRALDQLKALGYDVTLTPKEPAA